MLYLIVFVVGLMVGHYAGKKRQEGRSWKKIAVDLTVDVIDACSAAWQSLARLVQKARNKSADEQTP